MIPEVRSVAWATVTLALGATVNGCGDVPAGGRTPDAAGEQASGAAEPRPSSSMVPNLVVTILGCDRDTDSLRTIASIRNRGREDVRYVDVSLSWADAAGALVVSDVASIVGAETLMAGDSIVFDVATAHPQADQCAEARVFFYEPIP